ncbi:hypothetical protein [Aeromonas diversa]|uniref:Permease n=1 Tax=Aeromonas diversa CDC 2478-85 TaxID=1268237 RepID=N9TWF3_9GAMM|nr:hypothetical protein [Aeromonas diversa]ENY70390.1 hypothetical protein G114_18616 [Aeromonas diversa CDC 2478-85]
MSERVADYLGDRLEFMTFLASMSALLALLCGMQGEQALSFVALNLPVGLALMMVLALTAGLSAPVRLGLTPVWLLLAAACVLALGASWVNPLAVWSLYGLLGLELLWQSARPLKRVARS